MRSYKCPTFYLCIPSRLHVLNVNPSVHVQYVCLCRCAITRRRRVYRANTCVCVCVSVHHCHHVQPFLVRLSSRCSQVRSLPVSLVFEKQSNCTEVTATVCIYVLVSILVLEWLCLFLFDYCLIHAVWFCMTRHYHTSCVVPALLLTI